MSRWTNVRGRSIWNNLSLQHLKYPESIFDVWSSHKLFMNEFFVFQDNIVG